MKKPASNLKEFLKNKESSCNYELFCFVILPGYFRFKSNV